MLQWAAAPEHLWSQSPNKTWASFPSTNPNCQGAVSCQTWLRVPLPGRDWRAEFSLTLSPLLFLLPVCFPPQKVHSTSTARLWKQVDFVTLSHRLDDTYSFLIRKLYIRATDGRRSAKRLRFYQRLTLHIATCLKRDILSACVQVKCNYI